MSAPRPVALQQKYYSIKELAGTLQIGVERTRQLVMKEPDVLVLDRSDGRNPRARRMYRIPQSAVDRLIRRNSNPDKAA